MFALVGGCAGPGQAADPQTLGAPPPQLDVIWVASDLEVVTTMERTIEVPLLPRVRRVFLWTIPEVAPPGPVR